MPRPVVWSQDYKRKCFDAWYLAGRPNVPANIKKVIPVNDQGRKPSNLIIGQWLATGAWDMLADELDAKVEDKANLAIVNAKVQMLKKHQHQAIQVQSKSLDYLMTEGFDSAASAIQALRWGAEEERKTAGFSDLLEKLESMSNNQVRDEIIRMIQRATDNNQIVDGSANDIDDTVSPDDDIEE